MKKLTIIILIVLAFIACSRNKWITYNECTEKYVLEALNKWSEFVDTKPIKFDNDASYDKTTIFIHEWPGVKYGDKYGRCNLQLERDGKISIESVNEFRPIAHELGHGFGFLHSDNTNSIMHPNACVLESARQWIDLKKE